jgi:hypothetical protein
MKGKLVAFTPKLNNGVHETYQGQKGLLYKFTVTFNCNGTDRIGTANSTKQSPSWKVGDEYTFDETSKEFNGSTYINFSGIKSVDAAGFTGQKKSDPAFILQKCFECAVECSFSFFEVNTSIYKEESESQLIGTFYDFIVSHKEESERWSALTALRLAVGKYSRLNALLSIQGKHTSWILDNAKAIMSAMSNVIQNTIKDDNQSVANK